MKLKVLEEKKNRMVLEIEGETHTFCNALKTELLNDKHVKIASYGLQHPYVGAPRLIIETDGAEPKKVLAEAAKRLSKTAEELKKKASAQKW